jgi:hypothetical protein
MEWQDLRAEGEDPAQNDCELGPAPLTFAISQAALDLVQLVSQLEFVPGPDPPPKKELHFILSEMKIIDSSNFPSIMFHVITIFFSFYPPIIEEPNVPLDQNSFLIKQLYPCP